MRSGWIVRGKVISLADHKGREGVEDIHARPRNMDVDGCRSARHWRKGI